MVLRFIGIFVLIGSLLQSQQIASIAIASGPSQYNLQAGVTNLMDGDTFYNATCPGDGSTYVQMDDTSGFGLAGNSDLYLGKFTTNSSPLNGVTVNSMTGYGASDSGWKASGLTCLPAQAGGDVLLMWVLRQQISGSYCQTSGGFIKSYDHGTTWTNFLHPTNSGVANGDAPSPNTSNMFTTGNSSGQFNVVSPIIWAGGGGTTPNTDNQGTYVYFLAGLASCATPSDQLLLMRAPRATIENLDPTTYQVFTGGDGSNDANWSSTLTAATSVLTDINSSFPTQMTCGLPGCLYILSYYPNGADLTTLTWEWYTALHPWGPFTIARFDTWSPTALKLPMLLAPSVSAGVNTTATVISTGDYRSAATCASSPTSASCYYQIWQTGVSFKPYPIGWMPQ